MAFNLGAFAGGLAQGLNTGMEIGGKIKQIRQEKQDKEFAKGVADEARTSRERSIAEAMAGGATREQAEQSVGDFTEYYRKFAMPKIIERYTADGRLDQVNDFQKFMDAQETRTNMRNWRDMIQAAQTQDPEAFGRAFQKTYNGWGSGATVTGTKVIRDEAGNPVGMEVRYKAPGSQDEQVQTFNDMAQIYRMGIGAAAPETAFEQAMGQVAAQDSARAKSAQDALNAQREDVRDQRKFQQQVHLQDRQFHNQADRDAAQHGYAMERDVNNSQLRAAEAAAGIRGGSGTAEDPFYKRVSQELGRIEQAAMQPPGWERMSAAEKVEYARKRVIEIDRAAHGLRGSSMTMPGSAPVATGQPAARGLPSMY